LDGLQKKVDSGDLSGRRRICLSEDAFRQVKGRLDLAVTDLGQTQLKNIADPMRVYSLEVGTSARARPGSCGDCYASGARR
jgi:adenylate cyclase